MPAIRRTVMEESRPVAPYTLTDASKSQLTALTVAALEPHLKHFKLPVMGTKRVLVNHLHLHLCSLEDEGTVNMQANNSTHVQKSDMLQVGSSNPDAHSLQIAPEQADNNNLGLPQQLLSQLITLLQQAQSSATASVTQVGPTQSDTIDDDHLSAASLPVRSNLNPLTQAPMLHTSNQVALNPATATKVHPLPQLPYLLCLPGFRKDSKRRVH